MARGRPKKIEIRKGKTTTIKLSDQATMILFEARKRIDFDLSAWVSRRIVEEFSKSREDLLRLRIIDIQKERDELNEEYGNRMQALASELWKEKDRSQQSKLIVFEDIVEDKDGQQQ